MATKKKHSTHYYQQVDEDGLLICSCGEGIDLKKVNLAIDMMQTLKPSDLNLAAIGLEGFTDPDEWVSVLPRQPWVNVAEKIREVIIKLEGAE